MPRGRRSQGRAAASTGVLRRAAAVALVAASLVASGAAESGSRQSKTTEKVVRLLSGPLDTGIVDGASFSGAHEDLAFKRTAASGAKTVRLTVYWRAVAPAVRPAGFNPTDPGDPAYHWAPFDRQVTLARAQGLLPIMCLVYAPDWAQGSKDGPPGAVRPDPAEFGRFATAAARRYSGSFRGLPRVRYWQAWSEPNATTLLAPQYVGKRPFAPTWYRAMVNAFADAVHQVHRDNLVVAGGMAPFTIATANNPPFTTGPLAFMREMLCLSKKLKPTCKAQARFDVWSHHPYTTGGPTHHARLPNDVSIGDLPEMARLLKAAVRHRRAISVQPLRFWVTEFSWDTNPPDPKGVPAQLHARWVAEALYRMWRVGISLVTWFSLRDDPMGKSVFQAGLYFAGGTPEQDRTKPAFRAFRFPFVALPENRRVVTWGRTPTSTRGRVVLERRFRGGWTRLAVLRANRHGIFRRTFKMRRGGSMRARVATGEISLPFAVKKTRDRRFCPFGTLPNCPGPGSE